MSKPTIFAIYIVIDLLIVVGVVWCVLHGMRVSKYLMPAAGLLIVNGIWLIVMTIRNTTPGGRD